MRSASKTASESDLTTLREHVLRLPAVQFDILRLRYHRLTTTIQFHDEGVGHHLG